MAFPAYVNLKDISGEWSNGVFEGLKVGRLECLKVGRLKG